MSSVGKVNGDTAAGAASALKGNESQAGDRAQVQRGRHQNPADSIYRMTRFSDDALFDLSLDADSDRAKFLKSFEAAIKREGKQDAESDEKKTKEAGAEFRVIGLAERAGWTGLPTAAPTRETVATQPHLQELVDNISKLIAKALSAEAAPVPGQPTHLRLAFAEGNLGLSHLQVIMTASTLDVVLERSGAAASDELASAAMALADRLLTRFSKRSVRIMEQLVEDPNLVSAGEVHPSERQEPLGES